MSKIIEPKIKIRYECPHCKIEHEFSDVKEVLKLLLDTATINCKDCGKYFIIKNYHDE